MFRDEISAYPSFLVSGLKNTVTDASNQWLLTGAGASILILSRFDSRVKAFSRQRGLMPEGLSHVLDFYGGAAAYPAALFTVGAVSMVRGDTWQAGLRQVKYVWTSMAVTAIFTDVFKTLSNRQRPNGKGYRAFPSGHASGSFVVAATFQELYGKKVGVPLYVVAGLVGAQRIHDNKHWLTDVLAGAALGTVIGRGFGAAYRNEQDDPELLLSSDDKNHLHLNFVFRLN